MHDYCIGLNIKQVKKGGVQIKCWDLGGQAAYRSEWGRYIKGTGCICYVVDTHAVRHYYYSRSINYQQQEKNYINY